MRALFHVAPLALTVAFVSCGDGDSSDESPSPEGMGGQMEAGDGDGDSGEDGDGDSDDETSSACDADGDGFESAGCGGDDCDDENPNRYPGNEEVCDADNVDEDCDPNTFGDLDEDGDGSVSAECCNANPEGALTCGDDCNDEDDEVYPTQGEICDDKDNDCDGEVDENPNRMWFADEDGDGRGDPENSVTECVTGAGYVANSNDCDDNDDAKWTGADEDDCDGIDNDCDGDVDEESVFRDFLVDEDGDGFGSSVEPVVNSCQMEVEGYVVEPESAAYDCNDDAMSINPAAIEVCDGVDNDCVAGVDTGCPTDIDIGPSGLATRVDAGTSRGPLESSFCNYNEFLVGFDVHNELHGIQALCVYTDLVDGEVHWDEPSVNEGDVIGFSGSESVVCPENTFVVSSSVRFGSDRYVDAVLIECASLTGAPGETELIVTSAGSESYGAAPVLINEESACDPGEVASGVSADRYFYSEDGDTETGLSTFALRCTPISGDQP